MKNFTGFCLGAVMLSLAAAVYVQGANSSQAAGMPAQCPIAGDMDALQKDVDSVAVEMSGITSRITDEKIVADMHKMQEHLALVNQRLKKMHDDMDTRPPGVMASVPEDQTAPDSLRK